MKNIKYIGFYDFNKNEKENRNYFLSAVNKMNYIAMTIDREVDIISPSWTYNNKFYRGKSIHIDKNINLKLSPTIPWGNKLFKILSILFSNLWLFFYLLINTQSGEEIIVYHSLWLAYPIYILKRVKNIKLILEVEEIYSDVSRQNILLKKIEKMIIENSDKYIFSTELLNHKLNKNNKPYSIIYGTYQIEKDRKETFQDNRIHVVYAGTLDPRKGGATAAAAAAQYLDENYHIHILGFGSDQQKEELLVLIKEVSKITRCRITYDGLLNGEEYIRFLQKCHIGLSTQTPNAQYNDTSFPSKVLSYMSNGLRVVSIRIKALEVSAIGKLLYYYDIDEAMEIANKIKSINLNDNYDSREEIEKLNNEFEKNLKRLLER